MYVLYHNFFIKSSYILCGVGSSNSLIKGALELDGARTEQIFSKKFEYPLRRAIRTDNKFFQ